MNPKHISFLTALGLAALTSGCVGTGPNTQQGALTGATLGAIAGAVIGHNTGNHSAGNGALVGALAGGVLGGTIGNQEDHERGTLYTSEAQAESGYVVAEPPPPPFLPTEVIPDRPDPAAVWIGGYWVFNDHRRYEWVPGRWEVPPGNYRVFISPHWARRGGGWIYVRGYWRV
ncbi:MAG TPA: glycine zipper domain-containing protein [Candidatus Didemnitutus sp.]|jgi:hypothetical protein